MPTITTSSGIDLYYREHNPKASPTVILLHGLGANGESWVYQIPVLKNQGYRILIPDMRGFGMSSYPCRSHTIQDMVTDIIDLMDIVKLEKSNIVGISMGGAISLQLASEYPSRVQRLILVNTFAKLRPRSGKQLIYFASRIALLYTLGLKTQANYVAKRIFPNPNQIHLRQALMAQIVQANPSGYRATMRALARYDLRSRLSEINHPTLIITGENDRTVTPDIQKSLADEIPFARQVIIPEAGHGVIGEKPDEFNQELITFLAESA
jgi:3-oxoadipate enol-lactonase